MVSCHAIAQVQDRYIGDPLDIEMFVATKWRMNEEAESKHPNLVELVSFHSPELDTIKGKIGYFDSF